MIVMVIPMGSFIANLGRSTKIPFRMQIVIWLSGLRGAIAFALSMNMPTNNRYELFVTLLLYFFL